MGETWKFLIQRITPSIFVNGFLCMKFKCLVDPSVKIYWPGNVRLGKGVQIRRGSTITAQNHKDAIILENGVEVDEYCILNNKGGFIKIGKETKINNFSIIQATDGNTVNIGEGCAIAPYTRIVPNHKYKNGKIGNTVSLSTNIGNNVWIGAGVTIIIGANIGDNCIIGANSVVTKDIPSNTVFAGTPAKFIKIFDEYTQKFD